ncbi:hypothetical protein H072_11617 [Dactylellina haptotyla CBS 200.50]|uniref:CBM1 domain-containing protein n=1 Tax=Dactylellina haptotyla (strain CBS 200.50) TaxID=1284197 RepID=S8A1M4_DACHA|nr:hypothetical protein H072_11617 [Dactylellina haptotyla CBS 200.50]
MFSKLSLFVIALQLSSTLATYPMKTTTAKTTKTTKTSKTKMTTTPTTTACLATCITNWGVCDVTTTCSLCTGTPVIETSTFCTVIPRSTTTPITTKGGLVVQPLYAQCGGIGWTGPTLCQSPAVCVYLNAYHSQCLITSESSV